MMDRYAVEKRIVLLIFLKNLFLIAAAAATTLGLYAMSHSWHSLWPMALCLLQTKATFIRDQEKSAP